MPLIREPATLPLIVLAVFAPAGCWYACTTTCLKAGWQDYGFRAGVPDWTPARRIRSKMGTAVSC
jgi:hypothetical protein